MTLDGRGRWITLFVVLTWREGSMIVHEDQAEQLAMPT
jgi:hypothetical protein